MRYSKRKSLIITGIHGFVGQNLVKSLSDEYDIYGVDIRQHPMDGVLKIFSWEEFDQLPVSETVIHLAGIAHDIKNKISKKRYFDVNTGLTVKIFDWFQSVGASRFIFFSSVKAVADRPGDVVLTEHAIPTPSGFYGESKRAAEEYILDYPMDNELRTAPLSFVYILRPAMIYGPGNKGNLNLLYRFVKSYMPWPLGAFRNKRSFCSIDNIIFIVRKMLNETIPSGIYHIADDDYTSTSDLVSYISEGLGRKSLIVSFPISLIKKAASLGSIFHLPFNKERLKKVTENYMVSNAKIKTALGIHKLPVDSRTGIIQTIKSFRR